MRADGLFGLEDINAAALEVLKDARVESSLASIAPESRVQFERQGYFVADSKDCKPGNLVFNRFTGPGRVGLQSAYFHPPVSEGAGGNSQRKGGDVLGGIVGGLLDK